MKQDWFCDRCQRAGTCTFPKHAGIFEAINRLKQAHDQFSNPCQDAKIRVRNPDLVTRGEWRVQVSLWRRKAAA